MGDVIGLLDNSGNIVVEYNYDAWGKLLAVTGSTAETLGRYNPFRYRGYVYDEETGVYYLRSRYYNREWNRFINADDESILFEKDVRLNLFEYCTANPIILIDEMGKNATYVAVFEDVTQTLNSSSEIIKTFLISASSFIAKNWWNPIGKIGLGILFAGIAIWGILNLYEQYLEHQAIREKRKHGDNWDKTVAEILKTRKGSIRRAPIPPGGPSWDEILTMTLAEIYRQSQTNPKWHEIYKLLTDGRFKR